MSILDHKHPYFDHFMATLAGPTGCNFQWLPDANSPSGRRWKWHCEGHHTFRARAIIDQMNLTVLASNPVDIDGTLAYLAEFGGVCDCEIILKVPIVQVDPESTN